MSAISEQYRDWADAQVNDRAMAAYLAKWGSAPGRPNGAEEAPLPAPPGDSEDGLAPVEFATRVAGQRVRAQHDVAPTDPLVEAVALAEASEPTEVDDGLDADGFHQRQRTMRRRAQAAVLKPDGAPLLAPVRQGPGLQPMSWGQVLAQPDVPVAEIIAGMVPEVGSVALAGPPKVGKSLMLDQMGVAVGSRNVAETLGRAVRRHGPVLLVFEEGTLAGIGYRLRRQAGAMLAVDPDLHVLHLARIRLDDRRSVRELRAVVADLRPVFVGLDPLNRLHGADENRPTQMTPVMGTLSAIAYDFSCAVVVTHHLAKPSMERRGNVWDRFRGASSIRSSTDANLALDGSGATVHLEGEFRDAEPLRLSLELDRDTLLFRPVDAPRAVASKIDADALLAYVTEQARATAAEVADRFEASKHTALAALDAHADLDYTEGARGQRFYFVAGTAQ